MVPNPQNDNDDKSVSKPDKRADTAYLDGLRGICALLVYFHHHQLAAHESSGLTLETAFGFRGQYHFATFPGIRTLFTGGHLAVATFFVISGYSLSIKPLRLINTGDVAALAECISSALFRRWLRLYVPFAATTFAYLLLARVCGLRAPGTKWHLRWWDEVKSFTDELRRYSFVFDKTSSPWFSYNTHLWSIPVEFKGSLMVYFFWIAMARSSRAFRLGVEVGLAVYFLYVVDGWYGALFFGGVFLCELHHEENAKMLLVAGGSSGPHLILVIGLYLGGVPHLELDDLRRNPGWGALSFLKPGVMNDPKWFYLFWASMCLVWAVSRIAWLRAWLDSEPCQFLGRISFGLYLVHGPVLWLVGENVYSVMGKCLSVSGPLGLEPFFITTHVVLLPLTVAVACVVHKAVDQPAVKLGHWIYRSSLKARK
ncbi:acyltransferase 3 [Podospora aff. communis PSN243]|uniref:Acyltransferase 3 n=1 Tax=Podospora aff. communis PSN243 TaxID=3040156 RepID=A0AAV9G1K1_9PEZI|nr:acyltransferase 3 [Podospora aff. communis PSN243]